MPYPDVIRFLEVTGSLDRKDVPYPDDAAEEAFAAQYDEEFLTIAEDPHYAPWSSGGLDDEWANWK